MLDSEDQLIAYLDSLSKWSFHGKKLMKYQITKQIVESVC